MKISNKEKIMLCILGSIIVGFLYYQFVYSYQVNQLEEKIKAESEIKQKYDNAMKTIKSMDDKKSTVKILNAKIKAESLPFYPIINEENIIIELDKIVKDSGLKAGITFQPIVSNSVETSKKEVKSLAESSLQGIVDEYNSKIINTETTKQSNDKTANNSITSSTNTKDSNTSGTSNASNSNNSNESNKKDSKDTKKNTVQYLKCEVKFEGSYEGAAKLLNIIGQSNRKIVVNSIKLSSDTLKGIKGTLNLEYYSVPKIEDELEEYLKWDLNDTYGKSVPFGAGTALSNTSKSVKENKGPSDFIGSVKSIKSDLPTVMMGKANDDLRTTYVYADSNSEEKVEMILTQEGNKYYYKYKTSKGTYPANYEGLGAEFVPASQNIVIDLLSDSRADNDNSALNIKIINKTNKSVDLNISGDDLAKPRITVDASSSNVSVNKR